MGIQVIDPSENSRVPFLRGILTRSLRTAGLSFSDAYDIANKVRDRLDSSTDIRTKELTELVAKVLKKEGYEAFVERYRTGPQLRFSTMVRSRDGREAPFSQAHLARSLERCALPLETCYGIASSVEKRLVGSGRSEVTSRELAKITYEHLRKRDQDEVARRYLVWREFFESQQPLVVLLGGTTGSGKSTISAEVAHRLGIVRTQSTDMLREVMRVMLPQRLLPALHASSFVAWQTLPSTEECPVSFDQHFLEGYLTQARSVGVAVEGVLRRAEREQLALILEGVHIFPALQHQLAASSSAIVVPGILAVPKRNQLRRQLKGRGLTVSTRRAERYLEHFEAIWELQAFLLAEAERHGIAIIPNVGELETVRLFMETISESLAEHFSGKPEAVFD